MLSHCFLSPAFVFHVQKSICWNCRSCSNSLLFSDSFASLPQDVLLVNCFFIFFKYFSFEETSEYLPFCDSFCILPRKSPFVKHFFSVFIILVIPLKPSIFQRSHSIFPAEGSVKVCNIIKARIRSHLCYRLLSLCE